MRLASKFGAHEGQSRDRAGGSPLRGQVKWGLALSAFSLLMSLGNAMAQLQIQPIASGLPRPTSITHAGDGSGRLFITLQDGRIFIFDGTQVLRPPFLDIRPLVSSTGERGLLSVAFHPNFATNRLFFINYTNVAGNTVIARYRVSANPNRANPNSRVVILGIRQPFANHNGGQLQFGPDGFLYIGMGDGGSGGDPGNRAQDLGTLLGKMLRIDVNGRLPYAVPPDNPFVGAPGARPEIWAFGLRNPWRFSFDRLTNQMFIADVGQFDWEEVSLQRANSTGGENYGWRLMEGRHCFNPPTGCNDGTLTLPIIEYNQTATQGCSITGGYRYRGSLVPALAGAYLYADLCNGRVFGARPGPGFGWQSTLLLDSAFRISTFGEDQEGEIYFANHAGGVIFRITGFLP